MSTSISSPRVFSQVRTVSESGAAERIEFASARVGTLNRLLPANR